MMLDAVRQGSQAVCTADLDARPGDLEMDLVDCAPAVRHMHATTDNAGRETSLSLQASAGFVKLGIMWYGRVSTWSSSTPLQEEAHWSNQHARLYVMVQVTRRANRARPQATSFSETAHPAPQIPREGFQESRAGRLVVHCEK